MLRMQAYINGQFHDSDQKVEIISPLNLKPCGTVPSLTAETINYAFKSAENAFSIWKAQDQKIRTKVIQTFNTLLLNHKAELAQIMHQEIGKNLADCLVEIERSSEYILATIKMWEKIRLNALDLGKKNTHQIRVPLGVVLAISPFNYPVNLSLVKIIPALLAGNTIVFKAATNGSLTGAFLAKLFAQLNLPSGVFNYVSGRGKDIGDILTTHPAINMITFTGGVKVGQKIAQNSTFKPLVLELGGNDAAYVRHDADLTLAVKEIIAGAFNYAGQRCTAIKRILIHESITEAFITKMKQALKATKVEKLIDLNAANYIQELYQDALNRKDQILVKGQINQNAVEPILILTDPASRLWNEEQFGPILPLVIVQEDAEALRLMNQTEFGLQNSIFTQDATWALAIAPQVESGSLNINGKSSRGPDILPFSGIKNSGFGTQGVSYALESMTRILNVVDNK